VENISRNFYSLFEKSSWPPYSCRKALIGFFNFKLPVQNWDLLFLRSSAIYHRSLSFIGNRINLIFYSSVIKGKDIQLNTPQEIKAL
jgi:hypothetical protein